MNTNLKLKSLQSKSITFVIIFNVILCSGSLLGRDQFPISHADVTLCLLSVPVSFTG